MGRPKGIPKKFTRQMREVILEAFEELGGVKYLVDIGRRNPALFIPLLAKIIPAKLDIETGVVLSLRDYTGRKDIPEHLRPGFKPKLVIEDGKPLPEETALLDIDDPDTQGDGGSEG